MFDDAKAAPDRGVGICLGASTFSLVEVEESAGGRRISQIHVEEHEGDPKGTLARVLGARDLTGRYVAVTGRKFREVTTIPSIIEPEATEIAYAFTKDGGQRVDAIVSAGGESFIVYELDDAGKIARISSGNKCASGTGEFFLQQIRRMNIGIDEAVSLARTSVKPHQLSGRCSVFCKSDCTHALNKGEPIADVAAGLARMIASKIRELLVKIQARKVLVVGGTSRNEAVLDFLRKDKDIDEVRVIPEAPYFEALGAALWALDKKQATVPANEDLFRESTSSFEFLAPLSDYESKVEFKSMPSGKAGMGDECVVGLDVGSTTTKAVLFRVADEKILASKYLRTNGNPIEASRQCYAALASSVAGLGVRIKGIGVTGSGRYISALHAGTSGIVNEIIAHARAAAHFDPEVDTIFEIGGQDAKYTFLTNSVASDYAMNEACSAGTGSFLEESALESLGIPMEDIAGIALKARRPPNFSDQCAAFISSDINTAMQEGISREDIVAGLVYSICMNYVNRVKGFRQTGAKVFMQGGVCYNRAVPMAMAALTGRTIIVPPEPGLMGAYGVALETVRMIADGSLPAETYDLEALAARAVGYGKSFICPGTSEHCDRKCEIALIEIEGKKYPFGGACNKYYNQIHSIQFDRAKLDHVETRKRLLFEEFSKSRRPLAADAKVVGINRSFHAHLLLPMYSTFFDELGCKVVMPTEARQSGIDKGMTSFCLAGQIALGMFEDLLENVRPDYVFMPHITEIHVSEQDSYRKEFQTTCMFLQGEPWYQRATHLKDRPTDKGPAPVLLAPILNLMEGYGAEREKWVEMAVSMGFGPEAARKAHEAAVARQLAFVAAMKAEGRRILAELEADPSRTAVVYFGHPYSAFADEANKGVPSKFATRGVEIIPFDFLAYEEEPNFRDTYWEMGQRLIKAGRIVQRHPQLFGCYQTNFLCAIDSMMVSHFRDLMGQKPSLTIEVDSHTADAGVNTRIEAFMDVVRNYLKVSRAPVLPEPDWKPAGIMVSELGKVVYRDSDGAEFAMTDPRVKVIMPSMGDLFAEGAAAVLRSLGWNAEALPVCDREALDLGRAVTTSKECLPIINILGEIQKYLKHRKDPSEKLAVVMVGAGGCCRVGQYSILINTLVEKRRLRDVAQLRLSNDDGYAGLGLPFRLRMLRALNVTDIMDDIRSALMGMAKDRDAAMALWRIEKDKLNDAIVDGRSSALMRQIRSSVAVLKAVPLVAPISEAKYVAVVGEIFVRRDHFSLMGIPKMLADRGFVMLDAPVNEWLRYTDFLREIGMFQAKLSFLGKVEMALSGVVQDWYERKIKRMFVKSGKYEYEFIDIKGHMDHSTHFFPLELTGEPGLSSGSALHHFVDKYCGVISVGPFGCMNSRMTEAVATQEMTVEGKERASANAGRKLDLSDLKEGMDVLPFLNVECDGYPFSQIIIARLETFMLQAERLAGLLRARRGGKAPKAGV